ncbi:MAG: hypothetical protein OYG31_02220 [Candidatus Kaiserbacteria bacterium]|nr:hypothetical protein [Candidatus Kaiserbacteria bacterium]
MTLLIIQFFQPIFGFISALLGNSQEVEDDLDRTGNIVRGYD